MTDDRIHDLLALNSAPDANAAYLLCGRRHMALDTPHLVDAERFVGLARSPRQPIG